MDLRKLTETTNFAVFYDHDAAGAEQRAQVLASTCERDFTRLSQAMGAPSTPYGPSNRITIRAMNLSNPDAGAENGGFATAGQTRISVAIRPGVEDDAIRAAFVAELTEVFNDQMHRSNSATGWPKGTSFSEGISLAMTRQLYPDAYRRGIAPTPRVDSWLFSAREDRVAAGAPTEVDFVAHGCALLFLHYLRYQRNISWQRIIAHGGANLAETAAAFGEGFPQFSSLIAKHIAPGRGIETENPFPLLDPPDRSIDVYCEQVPVGPPRKRPGGIARGVRPYFNCPPADYSYEFVDQDVQLRCVATFNGFADPSVRWTVNGHAVTNAYPPPSFQVTASVAREIPNQPGHYTVGDQAVQLAPTGLPLRVPNPDAVQAQLTLANVGNPGRVYLQVTVEGAESVDVQHRTTGSAVGTMETSAILFEPAFYRDRERCRKRVQEIIETFVHWKDIPIWKTLPDPPPSWREAILWINWLHIVLTAAADVTPVLTSQVADMIAAELGVESTLLIPSALRAGEAENEERDGRG